MSIKIVLPESDGNPKSPIGTRVYTQSGEEIKNITRIEVNVEIGSIITATITVALTELLNADNLQLELSGQTKEQLALLGYVKVDD